jgi:choline dehydrogenase-like flavoprotein
VELSCEVLVIGSGPGGSITACELAVAGRDVVLCEEGPEVGPGEVDDFSLDDMRRRYRNGGLTAALGRTPVAFAEACCLGGGSEINAGLYHRLPAGVIDEWRDKYRIRNFDAGDLEPHFAHCERALSVSHMPGAAPAASLKLKEGAERLGWSVSEAPRWFRYGAAEPERQSMLRTYVPQARSHGCRVLPSARIERLEIRGRAAHLALGPGLRVRFREVFVCAGATGTPALLRRSGIRSNVGERLALHPTAKIVALFAEEVNDGRGIGAHQVRHFPRFSFGCSVSSPPFLAAGLVGQPGVDTAQVAADWRRMAVYYVATTSRGSGSVRAAPWSGAPIVRYRVTQDELADLAEGLAMLGRLLFEAGATTLFASVDGCGALTQRAQLAAFAVPLPARAANLMSVHLAGTCPMGEARGVCAADSHGKLHGYDNIHVNDSSLLPEAPGVNPQGTVMAIARRNALYHAQGGSA